MSEADIAPNLLPLLYEIEPNSGWHRGMHSITQSVLIHIEPLSGPRLELGCGSGVLLADMAHGRPTEHCYGIDRHPLALAHAYSRFSKRANLHFMQADLHKLPFADDYFSLVLALDTLDQKGVDLPLALREARRVLQPQGVLLLRVSAYQWLQGWHDAAFNTQQRYSKQTLLKTCLEAGFTILKTTHANTLLAPAVILLRLIQQSLGLVGTPQAYRISWLNRLVGIALNYEAHWLKKHELPFGLSIWLLLQKETE